MEHPIEDARSDSIWGNMSAEEAYEKHGVVHQEAYVHTPRGLLLFTQSWLPRGAVGVGSGVGVGPTLGLVMVLHGFTQDSSWIVQLTALSLARRGFAVYALDHQGHGRSSGLKGYIPNLNAVVDDCIFHFDPIRARYAGLPAFMYGESMGGAIALLLHLRQPNVWSGLVLNGAMCGISPKFKPPWPLEHLLWLGATLAPIWEVVPTKDIPTVSFKEPWKAKLSKSNPFRNASRPRLGTAYEFLRAVHEIESRMHEVSLPFLVVHGELDTVCDPKGVEQLYMKSSSTDKTLNIYPGMWHQLVGEPKENASMVFGDIYSWLEERALKGTSQ